MRPNDARAALNAGGNVSAVLARVWYLLEGGRCHAMSGDKLERAVRVAWRDPVATFQIERHGDPDGQMQTWRVDLARATAECIDERPLRVNSDPAPWDARALAAQLAGAIRAGRDDDRLVWRSVRRREVRPDYRRALGVLRARSEDAKCLRDALDAELGGAWARDSGWWVRTSED